MDNYRRKDLLLCVEGLGRTVVVDTGEAGSLPITAYEKGLDSLGCLQDLQRFLRADDDETKSHHIQLGHWDIVKKHLLPMLATYRESYEYVFEIIKLLVRLTLPAPSNLRDPTEYNNILYRFKDGFVHGDIMAIILGVIAGPLSRTGASRTKSDIEMLELILTLLCNLSCIQNPINAKINLQEEFLRILEKEKVLLLLIHLGNNIEEVENRRFAFLVLEILYHLFKNETPNTLAEMSLVDDQQPKVASRQENSNQTNADSRVKSNTLPNENKKTTNNAAVSMSSKGKALAMQLESLSKKSNLHKKTSAIAARHSKFGGLIVSQPTVKVAKPESSNLDESQSNSNKPSNLDNSISGGKSTDDGNLDISKKEKKLIDVHYLSTGSFSTTNEIEQILNPEVKISSYTKQGMRKSQPFASFKLSNTTTRLILKKFATDFLKHCFNPLMKAIKDEVTSLSQNVLDSDRIHFLWAIGFFPCFMATEFMTLKRKNAETLAKRSDSTIDQLNDNQSETEKNVQKPDVEPAWIQSIFKIETFEWILTTLDENQVAKDSVKVAACFKSLKNLLVTLSLLLETDVAECVRVAEGLFQNLIYHPELMVDKLPKLMTSYSFVKDSTEYLADLVEGIDCFLKIVEKITDNGAKPIVQLKKRFRAAAGEDLTGGGLIDGDDEDERIILARHFENSDSEDFIQDGESEDESENDQAKDDNEKNNNDTNGAHKEENRQDDEDGENRSQSGMEIDDAGLGTETKENDPETSNNAEKKKKKKKAIDLHELELHRRDLEDDKEADAEKAVHLYDYVTFFAKQNVIVRVCHLLRNYRSNPPTVNKSITSMLKRVAEAEGIAMLFQVAYLRIFASILNDKFIAADPDFAEMIEFSRSLFATFIISMEKDPVAIGLLALRRKKFRESVDLLEGTYLTVNSLYDGTLDKYESRYKRVDGDDLDELLEDDDDRKFGKQMSSLSSILSRNQPQSNLNAQEVADFDLNDLLVHKNPVLDNRERFEQYWASQFASTNKRIWTKAEDDHLLEMYQNYKQYDSDIQLVQTIASMFNMNFTSDNVDQQLPDEVQIFLRLKDLLPEDDFKQIKPPDVELEPIEEPEAPKVPAKTAKMARDERLRKKQAALEAKKKASSRKTKQDSDSEIELSDDGKSEDSDNKGDEVRAAPMKTRGRKKKPSEFDQFLAELSDDDSPNTTAKAQQDEEYQVERTENSKKNRPNKPVNNTKKRKLTNHQADKSVEAQPNSDLDRSMEQGSTEEMIERPKKKRKLIRKVAEDSDEDVLAPLVSNSANDTLDIVLDELGDVSPPTKRIETPLATQSRGRRTIVEDE